MANSGQIIRALDFPPTESDEETDPGTTGSTSYTATLTGGTACAVVFTAPTSGKVIIHNTARIANSSTSVTYCTVQVLTGAVVGSGSSILGASDAHGILHEEGANVLSRKTVSHILTGLTAGSVYNCQQMFRVVGNTGTYANKNLIVQPVH